MNDILEKEEPTTGAATSPGGQSSTIFIRPVHFALTLLGVVAFGGGIWLARARAEPLPPAQAAAPNPMIVQVDPSGGQQPFQIQQAPLSEISPGVVVPLEPPSHQLLGQSYIDISGVGLDGQPSKVSDYVGQPLMVNFWATWCPPCRVEMPWMESVYQEFKDQGFVILAVDAGERVAPASVQATVTSYIQRSGLTFPVLLPEDPYGPQVEYGVYGLPSTYMIDANGIVVDVHRGMYPNQATLRDRVVKLLEASGA